MPLLAEDVSILVPLQDQEKIKHDCFTVDLCVVTDVI